jgi:hypothetical protein
MRPNWYNYAMKKLISLFITCLLCSITSALASDEASLNQAISSLNARATTDADKKLVLKAVSQQTRVPEKTLRSQMSATHLGYGELLTVNSVAEGSGKDLNAVLAMKKGKGWASLSKELKVDSSSIVIRLGNAEKTVQASRAAPRAQNAQRGRSGNAQGPQGGGSTDAGGSMRGRP